MPEVSVIIPTYNSANTVTRAIQSVLRQTFADYEIIVVDDGSTDNTHEVLAPYLGYIRYIYQENQERSAARNRGIAEAAGDYVAFLDADDWWLPHKLERQIPIFESNVRLGLVYSQKYVVCPDGTPRKFESPKSEPYSLVEEPFPELVLRNLVGTPSTVVVRKSVLNAVGGFDPNLRQSEDWDLWLRIAAQGYHIAYVPEPLVYYQLAEDGNLTRLISRNAQIAWVYIIDKLYARNDIRAHYGHLELPARARVLIRAALIDCAVARWEEGRQRLLSAYTNDQSLFLPPIDELCNWIIDFQNEITSSCCSVDWAYLKFIDDFWNMLPANTRRKFRYQKNKLKGRLCAQGFFTAHQQLDRVMIRQYAWRAVLHDPSWLMNKGFVLIWAETVIGHRFMDKAKKMFKRLSLLTPL